MRILALRRLRQSGPATCAAALVLGGLLLAACGSEPARVGNVPAAQAAAHARLQTTPGPTPVVPHPQGNANSSGSFGPSLDSLNLPTPAPTAVPTLPAGPPVAATQPPSAGVQTRPLPAGQLSVRWRLAYAGLDGQIWTVTRQGTDPRVLLSQPAADGGTGRVIDLNPSPDATRLLYTIVGGPTGPRYFLLDLAAGQVTSVKYNGPWAQDSRHIVTSVNNQLVVADVKAGTEETAGEGNYAGWTADNQIMAVRGGNIWLIPYPASAGAPRQLTDWPAAGDGAWVFDAPLQYHYTNRILFAGAPRNTLNAAGNGLRLHALDVATRRITDLTAPGGNQVRGLALSPSGMQIAIAEQTARTACASPGAISVARPTGNAPAITITLPQAENDFYFLRGLTWSPDQWLAYSAVEQTCARGTPQQVHTDKIYLVNPTNPGKSIPLVDGAFPAWIMPRGLG
ncbi:MAG TPA: hypothetical protein VF276_08070 [Chloroflexia bacterium]